MPFINKKQKNNKKVYIDFVIEKEELLKEGKNLREKILNFLDKQKINKIKNFISKQ